MTPFLHCFAPLSILNPSCAQALVNVRHVYSFYDIFDGELAKVILF